MDAIVTQTPPFCNLNNTTFSFATLYDQGERSGSHYYTHARDLTSESNALRPESMERDGGARGYFSRMKYRSTLVGFIGSTARVFVVGWKPAFT